MAYKALRRSRQCIHGIASRLQPTKYDRSSWPKSLVVHPSFHTASTRLQQSYFHSVTKAPTIFGEDTIYALSTAEGRAGIAIVRISGPSCLDIYNSLCPSKPTPKPRNASLRTLYDPTRHSEILDSDALVLYFPGPRTVTGEDVLELHIHGGPATVKAVLSAISRCPCDQAIRYAEPGEFTRRAFQNDRLDLAQVEALSDTLSAETEQQRRAAVRGNSGKLGRIYEGWRQQLLYARGELEALIDFSEDQHFDETPVELLASVAAQVKTMLEAISTHRDAGKRGELLKKGIRVALLGPPNAGKSSLLNQIVGREASIVSKEAGTTRDVVEVSLDIQGYLCTFADTAGLRSQAGIEGKEDDKYNTANMNARIGEVELEGIRRAKENAANADVVIVLAFNDPDPVGVGKGVVIMDETARDIAASAPYSLIAINKVDSAIYGASTSLEWGEQNLHSLREQIPDDNTPIIPISCRDAQLGLTSPSSTIPGDFGNIKLLMQHLVAIFKKMTVLPKDMEDLIGVTQRQSQLLSACTQHLDLFIAEAQHSDEGRESDIVLSAEHLRSAANCLSRITGRGEAGDVEEVLGVVFEK